jgi:hypothetical protein
MATDKTIKNTSEVCIIDLPLPNPRKLSGLSMISGIKAPIIKRRMSKNWDKAASPMRSETDPGLSLILWAGSVFALTAGDPCGETRNLAIPALTAVAVPNVIPTCPKINIFLYSGR